MANPFRDMSVIMQALVAAAVAVVLVLVGVYVPGSRSLENGTRWTAPSRSAPS